MSKRIVRARELGKAQTEMERRLWMRLRDRQLCGVKFRRQHAIGPYVADLCSPERHLVVEVDGGQHAPRAQADARRTAFMEAEGFRVLRFWDNEVSGNLDGVLERISSVLTDPHPLPLPGRERESRAQGRVRG